MVLITGYYPHFIHHYASIAQPLTTLLQNRNFQWSPAPESSFEKLKEALVTAPVLALLDFSKPFIVVTDASGHGIGAMLSQEGHPIAFFPKKLSPCMQKASTYVRELQFMPSLKLLLNFITTYYEIISYPYIS